ncbi:flagellar hook-length control protein FliK [Curtobacterium flaccumfaciens pv. flaccumfaciens]|uniref:flagellar hook-length control protein FliK n=1 Tax=Curtobacterium flaccumfaciens TaxID=2035 RepID=UPI00217DD313|nr:flagellar hook-length control protein FliK [Curtobacterium flaccumfaciens]MCS6570074.1 flagellar hook-length control protein FliK [Curtobacterium flaccumfaciens pv. flaccumfaciens]MCS6585871.1 flagellar hook-length control protein FliK [Curtobacterium flaccumfaciens pv. flaccumfaciens]
MSLTIATQPSVPTTPGPTRGASSDPAAAGSFGAALTAAVATERRAGDGGAGRDDADGRTADGSAATPTSDQSVLATGAAPVDAQALLTAGLVAAPIAPASRSAETPDDDPHAVVAAGATAGAINTTTTAPPSVEGDASTPVPSTPAPTTAPATATPQQAPASGTAPETAAAATTRAATAAATTPAVTPAGTASRAAAATTVTGATPATTAVSTTTAATDPATTAPTAAAAIAAPAATRTADGDTATVTSAQAPVVAAAAPAAGTGSRAGHGTEQPASMPGDPGLPAVAPSRGGETPFVMSTTPTAAPAAATAPAPAPLAQQLARPVFSLAQAGPGEHVVTVQVVPDSLGPVTVRAHVTAHGMHVELFAASDAGREAVRQVLPDLRRDAAGTGVSTTLDLSSQNQPQDAPGRDERPAARALPGDPGLEARVTPRTQPTAHTPSIRTAGLDVLA